MLAGDVQLTRPGAKTQSDVVGACVCHRRRSFDRVHCFESHDGAAVPEIFGEPNSGIDE